MKYLVDGVEISIWSVSRKSGERRWMGRWRDENGLWQTKYLGSDDGTPEHDFRLRYRQVTKEPHAHQGTKWIVFEGQRMTIHLYGKTIRVNGTTYGPYPYWVGQWMEDGHAKTRYLGKNLPPQCEIIEGDVADVAPDDGTFKDFLIANEHEGEDMPIPLRAKPEK